MRNLEGSSEGEGSFIPCGASVQSVKSVTKGDFMKASKAAALLFLVGLLCWSGCGSDNVCDKAQRAIQNLLNAMSGCPSLSGGGDGGTTLIVPFNNAACQSGLSQCSSADQQTLSNAFDCISRVGRCVPGSEFQFLASFAACAPNTSSISPTCRTAFGY